MSCIMSVNNKGTDRIMNVKTNTKSTVQKGVDYDVFVTVLRSDPKVTIENVKQDGDIIFSVPLSTLGLDAESMGSNLVTSTDFFCNFVGEFIVRKNVSQFAEILFSVDPEVYDETVCAEEHTGFGTIISRNSVMRFSMHISLVQRILIEDFKKILE
jgi:hypothetical protein